MAIKIRGRNKFEVYLIMFWTVGWPSILIWLGDKLSEYIPESVLITFGIILYLSAFFLHFLIMGIFFKSQFNTRFNVNLNLKEYKYIKKHLFSVPYDSDIEHLSKDLRKALYIYLAYSRGRKKISADFIEDSINLLKENNLIVQ